MISVFFAGLVTFVPMYATPTASQLPVMAGRIAGVPVVEPPLSMLGDYVIPADVAAIDRWLQRSSARAAALVVSTDMLAYGGLDASRVPGSVTTAQAVARLRELTRLRAAHPHAWIGAFGTVMRLEPTSVTPVGEAAGYSPVAQYPEWEYVWDYAQLHDPVLPGERRRAERLRSLMGKSVFRAYVWTRERDRDVDLAALRLAADGTVDELVLGQDDAGAVGMHVPDVRALQAGLKQLHLAPGRAAIEPGADELGLALVAHALARSVRWTPRVAVRYSRQGGGETQDPLEFRPIRMTIDALIERCGAVRDDGRPDITLFVRVPRTTASEDATLLRELQSTLAAHRSAALVDLTYLTHSYASQARFTKRLLAAGIAGKLDAYSAWNTDANSVGIALGEAIAVGTGRRNGDYDQLAHAEFMFDRYIDDYLYHTDVRPRVNAELDEQGITQHYWLAPEAARYAGARVRDLMTPLAQRLFREIYPQYHLSRLRVELPWPRTDEIRSEIRVTAAVSPASDTRRR
jgi:hypothetical protein